MNKVKIKLYGINCNLRLLNFFEHWSMLSLFACILACIEQFEFSKSQWFGKIWGQMVNKSQQLFAHITIRIIDNGNGSNILNFRFELYQTTACHGQISSYVYCIRINARKSIWWWWKTYNYLEIKKQYLISYEYEHGLYVWMYQRQKHVRYQ